MFICTPAKLFLGHHHLYSVNSDLHTRIYPGLELFDRFKGGGGECVLITTTYIAYPARLNFMGNQYFYRPVLPLSSYHHALLQIKFLQIKKLNCVSSKDRPHKGFCQSKEGLEIYSIEDNKFLFHLTYNQNWNLNTSSKHGKLDTLLKITNYHSKIAYKNFCNVITIQIMFPSWNWQAWGYNS